MTEPPTGLCNATDERGETCTRTPHEDRVPHTWQAPRAFKPGDCVLIGGGMVHWVVKTNPSHHFRKAGRPIGKLCVLLESGLTGRQRVVEVDLLRLHPGKTQEQQEASHGER